MNNTSFILKIFTAVSGLTGIVSFVLFIFKFNMNIIENWDLLWGGVSLLLLAFIIAMFDYYGNRIELLGQPRSSIVTPSLGQDTESERGELPQWQIDTDLGRDDLKIVRWCIVFVKPGLEYVFPEIQEIVDYPTNRDDFARTKSLEFIQDLSSESSIYFCPKKWQDHSPPYPPIVSGFTRQSSYSNQWDLIGLPQDDLKYIRVVYQVWGRYPKLQQ